MFRAAALNFDFNVLAIDMLPKALKADIDMNLGLSFLQRFHAAFDATTNSKRTGLSPIWIYLIPIYTA